MNGHPQLVTPYNTSEFHAMVNALRTHHSAMHDQAHTVAVDLRKLLPTASGSKFSGVRMDLKLNAVRVTRHIAHAAALDRATARAYENAYRTYLELFVNAGGSTHSRAFNVDK